MTREAILNTLAQAEEKLVGDILKVEPASANFGQLLDNLANLRATIAYYTHIEGEFTATRVDEPVEEPRVVLGAVEPKDETPPPCEPAPLPADLPDKKTVMDALKAARKKGVNVADIIKSFGVDNFGDIDATKYTAVLDALKAEGAI